MASSEIREKYLNFFKSQGHAIISSAPLLPENDPTTLFTGSGMQPLVPYLLGEPHSEGTRLVNSQKCFRSQDIDEVGDNRHTTFFEMLGNWSLGDYFKKEQLAWLFEFLTSELGLDPKRLYVTVFGGNEELDLPRDDESAEIWKKLFSDKGVDANDLENAEIDGLQDGRIFYYDDTKNWWSRAGMPSNMPVGEPGGPDSEVFWDFGAELKLHENSEFKDQVCHVNCDCGRFFEIANSVFMQYKRTESGFEPLPKQNVDFGGGLERMGAAVMDNPDVFMLDLFDKARRSIEEMSGKKYGDNPDETMAFRVILDHIRAAVFLISDGATPSNKDQGYYTRRLIRRAVRFSQKLGVDTSKDLTTPIAKSFIEIYQDAYPQLKEKSEFIFKELNKEEDKFESTLEKGLKEFERFAADGELTGKDAFLLFSTYGFPLEVTQELAEERELAIDLDGFEEEMKKHQETSRKGAEQKFSGGLADHSEATTKLHTATHLMHQALRQVLGDHVYQKGSNITPDRLRFDFSHLDKMTPEEKEEVENIVNDVIERDLTVSFEEMTVDEAKAQGAIGVFDEKYGNKVKVYSVGDFSKEICGGPHVENTGVLGKFKIKKEEASSAGVRRIKAVLG